MEMIQEYRSRAEVLVRLNQMYEEKYSRSLTSDSINYADGFAAALEWVLRLRAR